MCLIYRRKDGTAYARLCYRTAQRGYHQELTVEQIANWHCGYFHNTHKSAKTGGRGGLRRRIVTFFVGATPGETVTEMARYMDARVTVDPQSHQATFYAERGFSEGMLRRAESFGWRLVS